ncbi:hypothetical protein [Litoribrevibacter albus]|uniref:Transporter substrate-binding domain-containing protein n=1 Tax=Litoribrevibacter albus TaxID=1473156 RepID=A0AA37SEH2_9GAMM|nr:hypothetical protein [Litoribrevibacter albus]GLQ33608.1 hypothetical protein GCM10007876_40880 [Litoribrevibacter albus]
MLFRWVTIVLLLGVSTLLSAHEVVIPRTSHFEARDSGYPIDLLIFVLNKANFKHQLRVTNGLYSQARVVESLKRNRLDVYWMGTSKEYEDILHAVPFPIYRGFLGYRIFIIHRDNQTRFNQVQTLNDLQHYIGVQGLGWSDIPILEYSGLKQLQSLYENLFKMINLGRGDYFSRSLQEVYGELKSRKPTLHSLAVEENLLLVYPLAMFFFTSHENVELSSAIERGFTLAYQDGSLLEFFYNHPDIKSAIEQSRLAERRRIDIPNPNLSERTLAIPKEYWHQ